MEIRGGISKYRDRGYTLHTIHYGYDKLARVRDARYAPGLNGGAADADLLRRYQYAFDLSGNRTQEIETIAGNLTTTNYGYNAANQMTSAGATTLTYDNNGNLLGDGTNTYTWDRANRMLAVNEGDVSQRLLTYDGLGNLVQQVIGTINSSTYRYLVDVNAPLPVVVREQASFFNPNSNYTRHQIHGPRGIHYHEQVGPYIPSFPDPIMLNTQAWMLQDGLGSVRGVADPTGAMVWSTNYVPFGEMFGAAGIMPTSYGFTGEQYSAPDLLYLRARHYNPTLGVLAGLDPFEGLHQRPMSLNGYSWVEGNVANWSDPSGKVIPLLLLPFAAALAFGALDASLQFFNNRMQGLDIQRAFEHLCFGQVAQSAIGGALLGLMGGLISVLPSALAAAATLGGALGGGGYLAGSVLANWLSGRNILHNVNLYSLSSNVLFGSILGAMSGGLHSGYAPLYIEASTGGLHGTLLAGFARTFEIGGHLLLGESVAHSQLITDTLVSSLTRSERVTYEELGIYTGFGATNIMSAFSGLSPLFTFLGLSFFNALGQSVDT